MGMVKNFVNYCNYIVVKIHFFSIIIAICYNHKSHHKVHCLITTKHLVIIVLTDAKKLNILLKTFHSTIYLTIKNHNFNFKQWLRIG